jgi:DNA invertase Pin-like site-specific DNA recombinase
MLIRQGMSLRKIAEFLETSHESVRRFLKDQGITMQPSVQKLTDEQLEEAYELLRADVSFREVAEMFGISDASLARLAKRDGVVLRSRGEKLTPTQRRLTTEQRQEARELVQAGESLRQTAKLFGVSRSALIRILKDGAKEEGESGE